MDAGTGFKRYLGKMVLVLLILAISGFFLFLLPGYSHLVILVIGILLMYQGLIWLRYFYSLKDWNEIQANIVSISEKEIDELDGEGSFKYFFPEIVYEYKVENKVYRSNVVGFGLENYWVPAIDNWGWPTKKEDRFWMGWKENTMIKVFVNPIKPSSSVIVNKLAKKRRSHYLAIIVSGLLLLICWLWVVLIA